jgi:hypothetical protein
MTLERKTTLGGQLASTVQCVSVKLIEIGARHNQGLRDRVVNLDNSDVALISNIVANDGVSELANQLTGVVEYTDTRQGILIPNGWGAERWAVIALFKESRGTGDLYHCFQGYTQHSEDISVNSINNAISWSPGASFIINKISSFSAIDGVLHPLESGNVFTPIMGLEDGSVLKANRPKDIINEFTANGLISEHGIVDQFVPTIVDDMRASPTVQTLTSTSTNAVGSAFFHSLLGGIEAGNKLGNNSTKNFRSLSMAATSEFQVSSNGVSRDIAHFHARDGFHASKVTDVSFDYINARHTDFVNQAIVYKRGVGVDNSIVRTVTGETQELISDNSVETKYNNQIIEMVGSFMFQNDMQSLGAVFSNGMLPTAQNGWRRSMFKFNGLAAYLVDGLSQVAKNMFLDRTCEAIRLELDQMFGSNSPDKHITYVVQITAVDALMEVKISLNGGHTIATTGSTFADSLFSSNIGDAVSLKNSNVMMGNLNKGVVSALDYKMEQQLKIEQPGGVVGPIVETQAQPTMPIMV